MIVAYIKVSIAYIRNNREDVHGRKYRRQVKKFGFKAMVSEYREGNTWRL